MITYILYDMSNTLVYTNVDDLLAYIDNPAYTSASFSSYDVVFIAPSTYISHVMYSMSDAYTFELSSTVDPIATYTADYYVDSESITYNDPLSTINDNIIDDVSAVYYGIRNV